MNDPMDPPASEPVRRRFRGLDARGASVAVLAPVAAGVASIPLSRNGPAATIAFFLLAIVISAVSGGLWAGLFAACLSSITLSVLHGPSGPGSGFTSTEEVVTALVFLAVALVVGILVGGAAEERARATRREREARLLGHLSSRFVSGDGRRRRDPEENVEPEHGSLADAALGLEPTAHQLHETPGDREAEPGPTVGARRRRVGLRERLEQLRDRVARDPDARVAHREREATHTL